MPSRRFNRIWSTLGLVVLLGLPSLAAAEVTVLIDGAAYPAELRENTGLLKRLHMARLPNVRHVEGELRGVLGSWIRASLISRRWQGVVALDGVHFVIDSPQPPATSADLVLTAEFPKALAQDAICGTEVTASAQAKTESVTALTTAQANLAQICQTNVNGVCLLAELEVAFDLLFQQRFPNTFQSQAAALLNVVDGFYRNDMNIQFDAITMQFMNPDLFSTTTDSNVLLDDVNDKKNGNQIPFIKNKRAFFHLVTGRSFDGSTVGIASVGTVCQLSSNTGTSQITNNSMGATALVVAHEIGHNFGAEHDGAPANACPGSGFIMAATLSFSATHFSQCSKDAMTAGIDAISNNNVPLCFEFPVDASLAAQPGNPATAGANTNFTLSYAVDEVNASVPASQLIVSGSLSGAPGAFVSATVNGLACTVPAGGATYSCSTGSAGGSVDVIARVNGSGSITVQSKVAASATGSVKDINPANDTVNSTVVAGTPPAAPTQLTAVADAGGATQIVLTWTDNSGNETGFNVERQAGNGAFQPITMTAANVTAFTDAGGLAAGVMYTYRVAAVGAGGASAPAMSAATQLKTIAAVGGGGGGGGSFGIELAPLLMLAAVRRRQRAA